MKNMATREAFGEAILEIGKHYEEVVVLDADLSGSTKTGAFRKAFPKRAFNLGIAEQNLVATAGGMAIAGKKPFACSFAVFITGRAYDQVRVIAISKNPVVLVGSHAGILTGEDGATHQALEDIGLMRALPNMIVLQPADALETKAHTAFAATSQLPVYLRLGRASLPQIFTDTEEFSVGDVRQLSDGGEVCLLATGALVSSALLAAKKLEDKIKVRVVNVSCLSPVDASGILKNINACQKIMTAEDHSIKNGLGSIVAEIMAENAVGKALKRIGMTDFGESGNPDDLYRKYGFDADGLVKSIEEFWQEKSNNEVIW